MSVDDLPPRPDPISGLPRPPHAPGFLGFETENFRERDPALAPDPPVDQGPVLVWYHNSPSGALKSGVICGLVILGFLTLTRGISLLTDSKYWAVWVLIPFSVVLIYFLARAGRFSAGAEWVAKRGRWVRIYELTKVTAHGYYNGAGMRLVDSGGRKVKLRFVDLSSDRLLWDLTYNGILHSVVAGGAKTNGILRKSLALPEPAPSSTPDSELPDSDQ